MKSYDSVFVYFNIINNELSGAEYQLQCAYIRSYLHKRSFHTLQYINQLNKRYKEYISDLIRIKTSAYIFYINEYNFYITKVVINHLKSELQNEKIIVIGPSANHITKNYPDMINFDISINHDYHIAIEQLLLNKPLNEIFNLSYRYHNQMMENETSDYIYSLDDLGLPYSEGLIPAEEIVNVGMITSTGCHGNCVFCSYNPCSEIYRVHEISSVIKEIDYIHKYISGESIYIRFFDDCFSVNSKRTLELLNRIYEKNYCLNFWCCTRADLLTHEIIDKMKLCKFSNIVIGLETASIEVMDKLGKVSHHDTAMSYIDKVSEIFDYGKEKNINPILSINFGLPNEKLEDAKTTIDFVLNKKAMDAVSVCFMTCFPGSKIFDDSCLYNVYKEESPTKLPYRTYFKDYDMRKIYSILCDTKVLKEIRLSDTLLNYIINDYIYLFTGINKRLNFSNSINNILIDEVTEDSLSFIDQVLDINGRVSIITNQIIINNDALFTDDRKRLKLSLTDYDKNLKTAYDKNYYLPNQSFVKMTGNELFIQPDNLYQRKPIRLKFEYIKNLSEIDKYINYASEYYINDFIRIEHLLDSKIINLCMFCGKCNVCSSPRINIEDKKVKICLKKEYFCELTDDYSNIINRIGKMSDSAFNRRNCNACSINKWCSKCIAVPNYFATEKDFCEFMQNHIELILYFKTIVKLKPFISLTNFSNEEIIPIYLAYKYNLLRNNTDCRYLLKEEVCCIVLKQDMYVLDLLNGSMFKCNNDVKNILLNLLGISNEYTLAELSNKLDRYNLNHLVSKIEESSYE